jgi:DNA invertase Pin-like site-specific DNA recombinase
MPILKDEKVEAGKIAKDDVVKGRAAAVVKIGTKFAEIRDADGKMILRAPLRQTVAILRPTPTEEEVAAQKAEREAQQRAWRDEAISGWLDNADDRYAGAVTKFSEAVAGGWAPQNYWDPVHRPGQSAGRAPDRQGGPARDRALSREERVRADGRVRRLRPVARPSPRGAGRSRLQRRVKINEPVLQRARGRLPRRRGAARLPGRSLLLLSGREIIMSSKIIGYLRVSTAEQADNGHSIDAQRAAITATAETRGWDILWVEDAASAKDLDRPGLSYALSILSSGQAGGIVVSRLDRLSRSVHDLAILLKRARAEGWNVVMLDYGLDLSTPYGEFGATMLMAAAQLERDLISARTKEGIAAAKAKGILPGPRRSTVPDEVIARVTALLAEGATLAEVANQLTQDHVPLPSGVLGVWTATQVRRVLRRDATACMMKSGRS